MKVRVSSVDFRSVFEHCPGPLVLLLSETLNSHSASPLTDFLVGASYRNRHKLCLCGPLALRKLPFSVMANSKDYL